jgi:hypothetical protein
MQVEKRPVHKGVHNVHTSLAGQTRDERTLIGSKKAAIRGRFSKTIRLRHVVTTTPGHE